jgi:hypothetical protein
MPPHFPDPAGLSHGLHPECFSFTGALWQGQEQRQLFILQKNSDSIPLCNQVKHGFLGALAAHGTQAGAACGLASTGPALIGGQAHGAGGEHER